MREAFSVSATTTGETTVTLHVQTGIRAGQATQSARGIQAQEPHANIQVFEDAKPVSPVGMAVGHIDGGMRELAAVIQRLTQRLSPVLAPACDRAEGAGTAPVPAAPAPLVNLIEVQADLLRLHCANLQDLERRLAL